jgi:hypothetical protein
MRHYSLLLGAALGLALSATASATDLPDKAKPVQYVKVSSANVGGFVSTAFYYEPSSSRRHLRVAQFDVPAKYNIGYTAFDTRVLGVINDLPFHDIAMSKTSKDSGLIIDRFTQRLLSSTLFYGSPTNGFTNLSAAQAAIKSGWTIGVG